MKTYHVKKPMTLLAFLCDNAGMKKPTAKQLLKHKQVRVNDETVTHVAYELQVNDQVAIDQNKHGTLPFPVLYEDRELIVINKPSGLESVDQSPKNKNAYQYVKDYLQAKHELIFLVHRLDRDTSGVLMFVKQKALASKLTKMWNELVIERSYQAIVEGCLKEDGRIVNYLAENKNQMVYVTRQGGKKAITNYQVKKCGKQYTLLDIQLETGRKNQIRVHMSNLHHPIAGDLKYGAKSDPLHRLALHANCFAFRHPMTHRVMRFMADLPEVFDKFMENA